MATRTLNVMLPEFARYVGAYVGAFTTTTNIAADTSVISTDLPAAGWTEDDALNGYFIRITSGNNSGVERHINDYTGSTGTMTLSGADLTADTASATFEIYRFTPTRLLNALNDGRLAAYPALYATVNDRSLTTAYGQHRFARPSSISDRGIKQVYLERRLPAKTFADNIVGTLDCDFEGDLTDWATSNITLATESETTSPDNYMVFAGSQSGKCTVSASAVGTMLLTVPNGTNYEGEEINIGIWVYSRTASRVSAAIQLDSDTISTGTAHSGNGWQRLTHTLVADGVSTSIKVGLQCSSGTAFTWYADEIIATAGASETPQLIGEPVWNWHEEGDQLVITEPLSGDKNLLIRGIGPLSSVSAGTDTMEVDGVQARLLYAYAAVEYFQRRLDEADPTDQIQIQRIISRYGSHVDRQVGAMAPMPLWRSDIPR